MAPNSTTAAPSLAGVHGSLQAVEKCLLEIMARAQAAGAPSVTIPLPVMASIAQPMVRAVMDLEALLGNGP